MKLVKAIIRPEKLSDVLKALYQADVRGLTVSRVQGHGGEMETVETYRGTSVKMGLTEKVQLDIGVSEGFVDATVNAVLKAAQTGGSETGRSSSCRWRRSTAFARASGTRPRSRPSRGDAGVGTEI